MPKTLTLPTKPPVSLPKRTPLDLKQYYSEPTGNANMPKAKWSPGQQVGFPTIKDAYDLNNPSKRKNI